MALFSSSSVASWRCFALMLLTALSAFICIGLLTAPIVAPGDAADGQGRAQQGSVWEMAWPAGGHSLPVDEEEKVEDLEKPLADEVAVDRYSPDFDQYTLELPFDFEEGSPTRTDLVRKVSENKRLIEYQKTARKAIPGLKNHCWRSEHGDMMCLPKTYLLGFPKCGTTDAFWQVVEHPLAFNQATKEPQSLRFKEYPWEYAAKYKNLSALVANNAPEAEELIAIDASPSNSYLGTSSNPIPQIISQYAPHAQVLTMVREPVARTWSAYCFFEPGDVSPQMFHQKVIDSVSNITACMTNEKDAHPCSCVSELRSTYPMNHVSKSAYSCHLRAFQAKAPGSSMKVVTLEDLIADMPGTMATILDHFRLPRAERIEDSSFWPDMQGVLAAGHINSGNGAKKKCAGMQMLPESRAILQELFRPFNADLKRLYGIEYDL